MPGRAPGRESCTRWGDDSAWNAPAVAGPESLRQVPGSPSTTQLHRLPSESVYSSQATKAALRSVAQRARALREEIKVLDAQLSALVAATAPVTLAVFAMGPDTAAALLVTVGDNPDRLGSERAFAHLCGVAPIPASSGKTNRHRLHRGGNRSANRALHIAVIVRMRYCPRTRAYVARRTTEGLSKPEIIRCLKRYLAREIYRTIRTDYAALITTT